MKHLVKSFFSNKLFYYISTRYITYFIQFISSVLIANKLGPYTLGVWGTYVLILNYIQSVNLGVPSSLNIYLIHNRDNSSKYIYNSFIVTAVINAIIALVIIVLNLFFLSQNLLNIFLVIVIGVIHNTNMIFTTVFRIKNSLFEIGLHQSIVPFFILCSVFLFGSEYLILGLLFSYLLGEIISLVIFRYRYGGFSLIKVGVSRLMILSIIKKGLFLFVNTFSVSLIILSTKTAISSFYTKVEFGYFTFSYTLSHSILLAMYAISFVVFSKIIQKLTGDNKYDVLRTIKQINGSYVLMCHLFTYLSILLYPLFIHIMPQYEDTISCFNVTVLSIVLLSNVFPYSSFLTAQNREKNLAILSIFILLFNILLLLLLVVVLKVSYIYAVICSGVSYIAYTFFCAYLSNRILYDSNRFMITIKTFFPLKLLLPFVGLLTITFMNISHYFYFFPVLLFLFSNFHPKADFYETIKKVVGNKRLTDL